MSSELVPNRDSGNLARPRSPVARLIQLSYDSGGRAVGLQVLMARCWGFILKRQLMLGVAFGAVAAATPAMATDFRWTGSYFGGNIGYSWGNARGDVTAPG